jgi:hypothetical protein
MVPLSSVSDGTRIDRAVFRRVLLAAVLGEMDGNLLGRDALEIERNARPIGR